MVIGLSRKLPAFARGGHGGHGHGGHRSHGHGGHGHHAYAHGVFPSHGRQRPSRKGGEVGPSLITVASTTGTLPAITRRGRIITRIIGTTAVPTVVGDNTTAGVTTMLGLGRRRVELVRRWRKCCRSQCLTYVNPGYVGPATGPGVVVVPPVTTQMPAFSSIAGTIRTINGPAVSVVTEEGDPITVDATPNTTVVLVTVNRRRWPICDRRIARVKALRPEPEALTLVALR